MVTVVGIGPGNPDHITPAAMKRIDGAEILIGGKRIIDSVGRPDKETYEITADIDATLRIIEERCDREVVVLVSGDPGFYSMLTTIRSRLPHLNIDVVPGISSAQLLCALIATEWHDVVFASVHGRTIDGLDRAIESGKKICVLTDDKITAPAVGRYLNNIGISGRAVVGRNLSYPDQELIDTTIRELADMDGLGSTVVYVELEDKGHSRVKGQGSKKLKI